jgi:hypothetical protein
MQSGLLQGPLFLYHFVSTLGCAWASPLIRYGLCCVFSLIVKVNSCVIGQLNECSYIPSVIRLIGSRHLLPTAATSMPLLTGHTHKRHIHQFQ